MTDTYKILFELEVTHTYFKSGLCEDLIYAPSSETQQSMDQYGLKMFLTDKGFQFYSTKQHSNEDFLTYLQETIGISSFEFYARTSNPTFYQFTDVPLGTLGVLTYNSELVNSNEDTLILEQQFVSGTTASNLFQFTLYLKDLIQLLKSESTVQYRIEFSSRTSAWQYNIINDSKQQVSQLSVTGEDEVEFDQGEEVVLENGQSAIAFTSLTDTIPYSEVPNFKFDLVNTTERMGTSREKVIFKSLPTPNPNQLQIINQNEQQLVVSPTYVYI